MAQNYENVLRLVLIILLLFFIASAMRVKDEYVTGNFLGLGASYRSTTPTVDDEPRLAYKYGCYDSDGGDNVRTRGVVTYRIARQLLKHFDTCQDSKTLLEWACLGGGKTSEVGTNEILLTRECTFACRDGACFGEIYREGQDYSYGDRL